MSDRDASGQTGLLPISDVARIFNVTAATVRAWEAAGKITALRTPGGQRRFRRAEVEALLVDQSKTAS